MTCCRNDKPVNRWADVYQSMLDGKNSQLMWALDQLKGTEQQLAEARELLARLREAWSRENDEIEQILGRALGFPRYCDDQRNFPGATEADGVCVGPQVAITLAQDASDRIRSLESQAGKPRWLPEPPKHRDCYRGGYYHVIPKDRDTWLDGGPTEVVYLYFDGKWSVIRPGESKHDPIDAFSHWYGPIARPELPPEVEAMLNADD